MGKEKIAVLIEAPSDLVFVIYLQINKFFPDWVFTRISLDICECLFH